MDAETIAAHKAHSAYVAGIPPRPGFAWIEGAPPRPWNQEWFFAQMRNGQCITLKAREGNHDYNYTTADETYWAGDRIARWMQIPDTEFVPFCPASAPPEERREDDCQLRMDPKAELTMVLEDLKTRDQSIKDLHAACDAKTAYGDRQKARAEKAEARVEEQEAELAALRGGKVGEVYYPGICEDDIDEIWRICESCRDPARAMAVEGYKLAMEHLPAGTELRDHAVAAVPEGKVLVDAGELEALRDCRAILVEHMETEGGIPMSDHLATSLERSQRPRQNPSTTGEAS